MHVGRNEPCPCGSGTKSKNCCGERARQKGRPTGLVLLIIVIAAIAALGVIPGILRGKEEKKSASLPPSAASAPVRSTPAPQPPGPVPPGKVWSAEHGHWHDAAPAAAPGTIKIEPGPGLQSGNKPLVATANASVPQPPGPVPAGKVWSAEHGHWHDAPPTP